MPDRTPTSVNMLDTHREWMESSNLNRSAFINDLITEYRENGGRMDDIVRKYRIQQLAAEIESEEAAVESKKDQLQSLKQKRESEHAQQSVELNEAREVLADVPRDPTNPAIKKWAADIGITPQKLIEELDADNEDDGE